MYNKHTDLEHLFHSTLLNIDTYKQ